MTLFLLSIWCVGREFIDAVDSLRYLSLSIMWWFQGLQLLCFCWRFMDQHWHRVFDNSMRQPWLYFLLSIWFVGREFIDAVESICQLSLNIHWWFWQQWLCFRWRLRDKPWHIVFAIPCISLGFIFAIDLMCRSWIHLCYRFHTSAVTQYSLMISWSTGILFSLTIYRSVVT